VQAVMADRGVDVNAAGPAPRANTSAHRALPEVIPATAPAPEPEPPRKPRRAPLIRIGLAVAATGTLVGGLLFGSEQFLPGGDVATVDYSQAADNSAGTQIAAHEGVHGTPAGGRYGGADQTLGHDVSGHQPDIDWRATAAAGARFVYIKASEGTGYLNPAFNQQYSGSFAAGMIRGAYHFARPDATTGGAQATYFVDHGGGWTRDGHTLPGALDMEYNPYGDACYGKDAPTLVAWIKDFATVYKARTGRRPVIYTSTMWWKRCTSNSPAFKNHALWLARYNTAVGELPAGWTTQDIWQFANQGPLPGDQNYYNGPIDRLKALVNG
jgi:GH25 family lysozyme M1 (1,4-beta-N-acetylmuramidase)